MKSYYLLENKDGVQVKVMDRAFAMEMKFNGWKMITTFTEDEKSDNGEETK